jgi:hypothetical protein
LPGEAAADAAAAAGGGAGHDVDDVIAERGDLKDQAGRDLEWSSFSPTTRTFNYALDRKPGRISIA